MRRSFHDDFHVDSFRATATAADCVASVSVPAGNSPKVLHVSFSLSDDPAAAVPLTIEWGGETREEYRITAAGFDSVDYPFPVDLPPQVVDADLTVTLGSGGAGVRGDLTVFHAQFV